MTCDALFRSRQMSTVKILLTGVSVTVKGLYLFSLHKILVIESQRTASIIRDQTSLSMHISQVLGTAFRFIHEMFDAVR